MSGRQIGVVPVWTLKFSCDGQRGAWRTEKNCCNCSNVPDCSAGWPWCRICCRRRYYKRRRRGCRTACCCKGGTAGSRQNSEGHCRSQEVQGSHLESQIGSQILKVILAAVLFQLIAPSLHQGHRRLKVKNVV